MYKPHRFARNISRYIRTCRHCEYAVIMEFNEKEGRIEEHIYKPTIIDDSKI